MMEGFGHCCPTNYTKYFILTFSSVIWDAAITAENYIFTFLLKVVKCFDSYLKINITTVNVNNDVTTS